MDTTSQDPSAAIFTGPSPEGSAGIYARLSVEDTDALAVARQDEDCRARADREGQPVVATFTEDKASAYTGKRRREFERLLTAMAAGEFTTLYVWRLDRLARNLGDYARVHEAAEEGGVRIVGVADGVDTATPAGAFLADIMFSVAKQESRTTSARVARRAEQAAKAGEPGHGPRAFGWEPDGVTQRPDEADAIRDAADRLLSGESLRSIAYALGDRGCVSPQVGRPMTATTLRDVLLNPRQAGLRRHRKQNGSETIYPGTWSPILARETWEAVCARLHANDQGRVGRPATGLLSGFASCGRCGSALRQSKHGTQRRYRCMRKPGFDSCGSLSIALRSTEAEVRDRLIARLASPELAEHLAEPDESANQAARELTAAEDRLDELAGDYANGIIGRREWLTARDKLDERIRQARATLDAQQSANVLAGLPDTEDELRARWDAAGMDWRRSLLMAMVESVTIAPGTGYGGPFDPERVQMRWRV